MQKVFDKNTLDNLRDKLPIEEYISNYIELSPRHGKMFGICPFHKEDTPSFMVDIARQRFHCFGCKAGGDIFTFIMRIDNLSFREAVERAATLTGISVEERQISETLNILKKIKTDDEVPRTEHRILDKSIYDAYENYIDDGWLEEGVPVDMFEKYEIKLDRKSNRIIYPVYDSDGNFINIKGRTRYDCYKALKIPKYMNYYKVGCMDYLQGLHLSKKEITSKNEVIIFEGLKSCMKAEGFGYHNVVSAETSGLTREQIELILSLHCDVVIAFDKDKRLSDYLTKEIKMLARFVNLYYIDDRKNLLGKREEKNSPVDKGKEIWEDLYNKRKELKCY